MNWLKTHTHITRTNKPHTHTLIPDKSFNTHSRFALPKAAGTAGSCWNSSRYRKLLELLVRQSRPHLVAESARDRRLATACAVGTAGISHLVVGTTRVWLLELLAFGCCLCSRLAAACARVWLLILLVESRVWLLLVLVFDCYSYLWNLGFNSLKTYFISLIFIFFY